MAARPVYLSWLCLLFLFQCRVTLALEVTPGSACAALCLNNPESDPLNPASSWTGPSDVTCSDDEYSTTSAGIKFKNCLDCLRDSRDAKNGETDMSWFLYNLRYSVNVCLYGFPNVSKPISSPCDINYACEPLKTSLRTGNLVPNNGTQLDYCDADGGKFMGPKLGSCLQCLQASTNQEYTANFMIALKAGCEQRPKSGGLLGLGGNLFANTSISITTPPVNDTDLKTDPSPTGMTTGAVVGIAVGAALLFLGGSVLFFVYYRKQKKLYGDDLGSECDNLPRGRSSWWTPDTNDDGWWWRIQCIRPQAALGETHSQQKGYGNNADYYDEIEKEMQATRHLPNYNFDPNNPMRGPNGALPTHPAYIPKPMSRAANSRDSTPEPPRPAAQPAQHQLDPYAAYPYMNAAPAPVHAPVLSIPASTHQAQHHRRTASIPPPPPGPPPSQQQPQQTQQPAQAAERTSLLPSAPPPPPPPQAPRLALPSLRRLRVPKKYAPPQITVEEPTPVSSPSSNEVPIGLEISNPLPQHLQRFADEQHPRAGERGGASSSASQQRPTTLSMANNGGIRQQHAVDQRQRNNSFDYVEIYTSKSDFYG
ncbi:exo-alpha-sialidase neuraminidase protein [Apiospora kogelbergensis]|uniref:exo-alpha-sialidase neuraminidase protein n=1 Tax=Apiospora kogelbergensis TaxID=1337665 RepID=UPI00312CFBA6